MKCRSVKKVHCQNRVRCITSERIFYCRNFCECLFVFVCEFLNKAEILRISEIEIGTRMLISRALFVCACMRRFFPDSTCLFVHLLNGYGANHSHQKFCTSYQRIREIPGLDGFSQHFWAQWILHGTWKRQRDHSLF